MAAPLFEAFLIAWFAVFCPVAASAQSAATPQRPTFSNDASTTAPGTFEIEFGGGAAFDDLFTLPTTVKFTPALDSGPFQELEWSVSFDGFVSEERPFGGRRESFAESFAVAARKAVFKRGGFQFAVAPQALVFRRGPAGARFALRSIGTFEFGAYALVGNFIVAAATDPSAGNPGRRLDSIVGLARSIGRASVFAEALYDDTNLGSNALSLQQGASFALRHHLVFDVALQQSNVDENADVGVLFGLTVNMGGLGVAGRRP